MAEHPMLSVLTTLYGEPKTDDPKTFMATYANALSGFDKHTLKQASQIVARTRKISSWPTIGECIDAAKQAEKQVKSSVGFLEPIENWDHWYGQIMRDIAYADNVATIDAAIEKVRPYAIAKWCYPHRLDDAEAAGAARRKKLLSDRISGDAA